MNNANRLDQLINRVRMLGKENLEEILHSVAEGIRLVSGIERIRIYLEDLTIGAISCVHASGPEGGRVRSIFYPIVSMQESVSRVFATREAAAIHDLEGSLGEIDRTVARRFGIASTYLFPLSHQGKSIGVIAIDRENRGAPLEIRTRSALGDFIPRFAEPLDRARIHHQQLVFSRTVDEYKKRQAASLMVESAVRLIGALSLASVLVPVERRDGGYTLEILASHATDPELKGAYDRQGGITLVPGGSLISRFVDDQALIIDDALLAPYLITDLTTETLQKRALTEEMALRSLYVVPRYDEKSRRIICLVNYFTRETHHFSEFERGILETHAEMVERMITEIGTEHLEIKVLAEISELLHEPNEGLRPFLSKTLSKATELIGADTGSIALVEERDGERWLVVEEADGTIVGAKSKSWLKKYIPPFRIGGEDLPRQERSLTGYVAWTKQPKIIADVREEQAGEGFHRSMHDEIRSEIAVPVICDDEVIAVICLNSLSEGYFTEEHRRILQIVGRMTARHIADVKRIESLQNEVSKLATDVAYKDPHVSSYRLGNIIGNSRKSQEVVEFINTVTPPILNRILFWDKNVLREATIGLPSILVTGPTGAGKEFFFNNLYNTLNALYRQRTEKELPVKKTNIAAYSGELTYSELFGHKKGAFTGAYSDRKGILEECQGGIVFLDEIGDADPKTQVQLLRFLDNGGFVRLGENIERFSRVLLVAATNRDLQEEIRRGRFREDLYHRLSELSLEIPSLNDRREDIPDLATHFLGKLYRTYQGEESSDLPPWLDEEAKQRLISHHYQGNIRELRSILLRALFFRSAPRIGIAEIERAIRSITPPVESPTVNLLTSRTASEIMVRIASGSDFWREVYEPFSKAKISRDVVRQVIEQSRASAGSRMPNVARHLRAVTGSIETDPVERRRFFKFKNFLYKTVRLGEHS
ncbi:MAG: GPMC system transcriptional regulator [Desulfuromonadia bacterium]